MMTWPHRNKNVPNLFGHIHSGPVSNNDTDNDQKINTDKSYTYWDTSDFAIIYSCVFALQVFFVSLICS